MEKTWYLDECYRQLNNPFFYEQQGSGLTDIIQKRVTEYIKRMLNDGLIDSTCEIHLILFYVVWSMIAVVFLTFNSIFHFFD